MTTEAEEKEAKSRMLYSFLVEVSYANQKGNFDAYRRKRADTQCPISIQKSWKGMFS